MTNSYKMQDNKKVIIIINCLGRRGLKFMQRLNDEELEKCKITMGLFEIPSEKFKPQPSETISSLKDCKVGMLKSGWAISEWRQMNVSIKEQMIKVKFINSINKY